MYGKLSYRLRHKAGPLPSNIVDAPLAVFDSSISFLGEVDPQKGMVKNHGNEKRISSTIMIFPQSRGSTVGSYVVYALKYYKKAPLAMLVEKAEPLLITGCVLGDIPLFEFIEKPDYRLLDRCERGLVKNSGDTNFVLECKYRSYV